MTDLSDRQKLQHITGQAADARLNVELETEGMTLNIGPQHPATHGTLRILVRLDGEQVVWADPMAGYMHRVISISDLWHIAGFRFERRTG